MQIFLSFFSCFLCLCLCFCSEDDNLIELLWCNGHVVMQSQNHHRKLPPRPPEKAAAAAAVQEDEAGLWFPFALADSLEKDIFSDLFYEAPVAAAATAAGLGADGDSDGEGKPCKDDAAMAEERGGPGAARPDAAAQVDAPLLFIPHFSPPRP